MLTTPAVPLGPNPLSAGLTLSCHFLLLLPPFELVLYCKWRDQLPAGYSVSHSNIVKSHHQELMTKYSSQTASLRWHAVHTQQHVSQAQETASTPLLCHSPLLGDTTIVQ